MATRDELNQNQIFDWQTIKPENVKPELLLGNGFSLLFARNFSYSSLFELFLDTCTIRQRELFSHFGTNNFELILKYLTYSKKVNTILGLPTEEITTAIEQLKNGLITVIESVHPRNEEIDFDVLTTVARRLNEFGDIFTTNYDLYLYHIIMISNDLYRSNTSNRPYQDWFWGRNAPAGFLEFMTFQNYVHYKHIFYLHGALFIFNRGLSAIKITRSGGSSELINLISEQIRQENIPTFVSEGSGEQKQESIQNNYYLAFCINKLKNCKKPILIFGNSLSEFDSHILNSLKYNIRDIYYCIFSGTRTIEEINLEKNAFSVKMHGYGGRIIFVDSTTVFNI